MPRNIAPADSGFHTNRRFGQAVLPTGEASCCDEDIQSKGVQGVSQTKCYVI